MMDLMINGIISNIVSKHNHYFKINTQFRISKLKEMKEKIKTSPDEVELWLEEEISKIEKIDLNSEIKNHLEIE